MVQIVIQLSTQVTRQKEGKGERGIKHEVPPQMILPIIPSQDAFPVCHC